MKRKTFLKRTTTTKTIGLILSLGLLISSVLFSPLTAQAQTMSLAGNWHCSQNFWDSTLSITQSGLSIGGTLDGDYISGYLTQDPASGAVTGITFTRYGSGFTQTYTGKVETGRCTTVGCPVVLLHGMFNHNGTGKYGWYASR